MTIESSVNTGISRMVLASASPRRLQLLGGALPGTAIDVIPAGIDERRLEGEPASEYVIRMAEGKALCVAGVSAGAAIVLAADTIVVCDGRVLGKPADADEAREMLSMLSGRTHVVMTAVAVVRGGVAQDGVFESRMESIVCKTDVKFAELSPEDIDEYIATGEPLDKAGAYGIQGGAAKFVESINGSYTNVVGLPLAQTLRMLK